MNVTRSQLLAGAGALVASSGTALAQTPLTSIRIASSPVTDAVPLLYAYGIAPNRVTLEAFLDYTYEQGVCARRLPVEELFAPQTLVHALV